MNTKRYTVLWECRGPCRSPPYPEAALSLCQGARFHPRIYLNPDMGDSRHLYANFRDNGFPAGLRTGESSVVPADDVEGLSGVQGGFGVGGAADEGGLLLWLK